MTVTKISIIIPVFNADKYLACALDSVLKQGRNDWEIILINDGSTDNSAKICEDYADKDGRISVYHQSNKGQAAARNIGLRHFKGEFVTFLDADDEMQIDTLEKNIPILEENPKIDFVQYPVHYNYGKENSYLREQVAKLLERDMLLEWIEKKSISWIVCDKIFRKSVFFNHKFREGMVYEDNYLIVQILSEVNYIYLSPFGQYLYYSRENSTTKSLPSQNKIEDMFFVTEYILQQMLQNNLYKYSVIFLCKLIGIRKSLLKNYGVSKSINPDNIQKVKYYYILVSNLSLKDQVRLILAKNRIFI